MYLLRQEQTDLLFKIVCFIRANYKNESREHFGYFSKIENLTWLFCLCSLIFTLSHKAQVECQPICLLHPVMHFLKSKQNSKLGANLQSKSTTEKFSWLILIKGSTLHTIVRHFVVSVHTFKLGHIYYVIKSSLLKSPKCLRRGWSDHP